MVEMMPSLFLQLLEVVHDSVLILHIWCTITVHLLVKLQLGPVTEGASVSVCLDHMVSIQVIIMLVLCQEELVSIALHPTHVYCSLPMWASFIEVTGGLGCKQGVDLWARLWSIFLWGDQLASLWLVQGILLELQSSIFLKRLYCLLKNLRLTVKSPTNLPPDFSDCKLAVDYMVLGHIFGAVVRQVDSCQSVDVCSRESRTVPYTGLMGRSKSTMRLLLFHSLISLIRISSY